MELIKNLKNAMCGLHQMIFNLEDLERKVAELESKKKNLEPVISDSPGEWRIVGEFAERKYQGLTTTYKLLKIEDDNRNNELKYSYSQKDTAKFYMNGFGYWRRYDNTTIQTLKLVNIEIDYEGEGKYK